MHQLQKISEILAHIVVVVRTRNIQTVGVGHFGRFFPYCIEMNEEVECFLRIY